MSTTVTYKGSTIATVSNNTKTLKTSGKYLEGDVILVDVTQAAPIIQSLTATPTESEQTFNASGIDGYKPVTVGAISSTYVGSGIDRRDDTDLTASGATVSVPAGYYSADASKAITSGSAIPAASISGTSATLTTGTNTLTLSKTISNTPQVSAGYISSGTAGNTAVSLTASVNTRSSSDLTASGATVTAPAGYYASSASKAISNASWGTSSTTITKEDDMYIMEQSWPNFSSGYVDSMEPVWLELELEDKSVTPSTSQQVITPTDNYSYLNSVTVSAMPSGTAGTPTASKGTVSNHSISITPSVTNTTGYITGGTKTGTAVTVSASELVSGTYTVSESGTANVTNYANVNVPKTTDITAYYDASFITESNVRKCKLDYGAGAVQSGWVDSGDMWSDSAYLDAVAANTTITPTTSAQTVGGVNYMMEGAVTVAAIPSQYIIPSGTINITSAGTTDVTQYANASVSAMTLPSAASASSSGTSKATIGRSTSAQYINIPTGYNATAQYYTISATPNGTVTAPSSISGTSATVSTGTNTLTLTKTVSVTPNVTTAGYISSGTAGNASVSLTASVTTKAAATITPGTSNQTIASGTYLTGTQTIAGDADLTAANIKAGVNIFNVAGTYTSDATATASDIISGETAYVDGRMIEGTLSLQTYYTGSSAPSSSLGQDGDIYLQT